MSGIREQYAMTFPKPPSKRKDAPSDAAPTPYLKKRLHNFRR